MFIRLEITLFETAFLEVDIKILVLYQKPKFFHRALPDKLLCGIAICCDDVSDLLVEYAIGGVDEEIFNISRHCASKSANLLVYQCHLLNLPSKFFMSHVFMRAVGSTLFTSKYTKK